MNEYLTICSPSYESYSTSYGFVLPILPIKNRDSKYATDIKKSRFITVTNHSVNDVIKFSHLDGIEYCDDSVNLNCELIENSELQPNESVVLKLPEREELKILFEVNGHIFYEKLESFTDKHWSLGL